MRYIQFYFSRIIVAAAAIVSSPGSAGTLIPVVPYPGSAWTDPFDVNDQNVIAGAYGTADGNIHAFFGTLDGQYTSFDEDTDQGYTQANAISKDGWITGIYLNSTACDVYTSQCGFVRKPDGTSYTLMKDGTPLGFAYPRQMTDDHVFVGSYLFVDSSYNPHHRSFLGKRTVYRKNLRFGRSITAPRARGTNSLGTIVGRFENSDGNISGFIRANGSVSIIEYPDSTAVNTYLYGVNDSGIVTGSWDTGGPDYISRGFTYDSATDTFYPFHVTGESAYTYLEGINNQGFIAVRSDAGSFVYCPKRRSKCPGGTAEASFGKGIHVSPDWFRVHHHRYRQVNALRPGHVGPDPELAGYVHNIAARR